MAGRNASRRIQTDTPYEPSPAALAILRALAQFHYLTVEQIIRLFYKPGTKTTVQTRLRQLYEAKYCERRALPLPPLLRGGGSAYVYTLGPKGRALIEAEGFEVPARFRPSEIPQRNQ